MESSFLYEDTPDQEKATIHVKRDMESHRPMDRLICGDVGYGKTEVAVRAAFKAVQDGKQVAVLAPTTILVEQHRHTFAERLADYPVKVGALSRFRSSKEQKEILLGLANGQVDIVVGTHRLLSKDVDFSDLGLLIIDEEQRFGVSHKERLTGLRASIDILSLSATPIPRTLHLSLSGIRDLSLIQTPPRDRISIMTSVVGWTDQLITEALHRELDRGGQAFFLHNRVETIYTTAEELRALIPEANIGVAHGQMSGHELDKVMRSFVEGALDVLVCSSIIENGLDVQNANTLIVDRADRFGLSQLYQIRGRVGRSDRRAYCYLLAPDDLSTEARKRLTVLEHYTELGSGYSIALRDLELRGAGNLLGAEQSGFAQQVGLDTYMRLLKKTVKRLQNGNEQQEWPEPDVSLRGPAYLPEGYISDSAQKLHFYRRLSRAGGQTEIEAIRLELADRFGSLPPETARLLDASVLRILGRSIGVERIIVNKDSARVSFREGIVPKMAVLEGPLKQRQAKLEVRRITPLSLLLYQTGADPILETVTLALAALSSAHSAAA
jgi:transcription-repair coupling factor (superfamily II helicase)